MSSFLLKAENIGLQINQRQILENISLSIKSAEILTLVGPNGSGKTSLVRVLLGLLKADQGKLQKKPDLVIGYVPQKMHIDATLPMSVRRFLKMGIEADANEMGYMASTLGIVSLLDQPLQSVSGGEFQRILLTRALLRKPDLLVLDEPAQGVDINGQQQLYQLISSIRDEFGCGVLMVSHDLHLVMEATDQVLCLNTHICCSGHPEAVSKHPEYLKLFGASLDGIAVYTHNHNHSHDLSGDVVEHQHHEGCNHDH
ncbi:MAG: zinc ABC transporter ATP-binding protein ZnuC [endosymbiont of Galathealinum brachiosum]|uniref:Zinc ABC transporter ATP-binding protein ZnuC n=1 Tax=endosymbiont of Galathealinum brachiosum TaxID=2200906 RepID=A0A370DBK9_9GAMM|nr:MAG: zinc ABC transporter ATP-binding protein ZnuC [endosymbiont of Galathealinum brachiosum]